MMLSMASSPSSIPFMGTPMTGSVVLAAITPGSAAAIGGVAGGLLSFSLIFNFNPVWWLCLVILLGGMVGTSRMILRQHTLPQVVVGFFVGLLCSAVTILLV